MSYKHKIINDPVYGFITLKHDLVFEIISHPYFQRLRRIKQLGLSNYVYPGANHTRFHHALGAMHLAMQAVLVLRSKNIAISDAEEEALCAAVLLHDIGHGPFSHALENSLIQGVSHEQLSVQIMELLNKEMNGRLSMAISIFKNQYAKKFLHQLVSSQLDVDRLDYLARDSFFTGVAEGVISHDRIINMLSVVNDELVIEEKGLYSVEKFLTSRRLMYWQVYLHKTVISAEQMLVQILKRARQLQQSNELAFCTPLIKTFLSEQIAEKQNALLHEFLWLDDDEIMTNVKYWQNSPDKVLALLCQGLLNRKLMKVSILKEPTPQAAIDAKKAEVQQKCNLSAADADWLVLHDSIGTYAYSFDKGQIKIAMKNGELVDVLSLLPHLDSETFTEMFVKYYFCWVA